MDSGDSAAEGLSTDALESIDNLRYILEELLHQIEFLEKSQKELQSALDEKYDEEFSVAIFENEGVISSKRARAFRVHDLLMTRDASYRQEPYIVDAGAALSPHSTTVVAQATVLADASGGGIHSSNWGEGAEERGGESSSISDSTLSDRAGLYL